MSPIYQIEKLTAKAPKNNALLGAMQRARA
jgi:hypothetical protein